jgi:hypothetical protein
VTLETLAVFVCVLGHRDQQQYLNIEPGYFRVKDCDLALNKAGLLELTNPTPTRGSGHADKLGKLALITRRVTLQLIEETSILSG